MYEKSPSAWQPLLICSIWHCGVRPAGNVCWVHLKMLLISKLLAGRLPLTILNLQSTLYTLLLDFHRWVFLHGKASKIESTHCSFAPSRRAIHFCLFSLFQNHFFILCIFKLINRCYDPNHIITRIVWLTCLRCAVWPFLSYSSNLEGEKSDS